MVLQLLHKVNQRLAAVFGLFGVDAGPVGPKRHPKPSILAGAHSQGATDQHNQCVRSHAGGQAGHVRFIATHTMQQDHAATRLGWHGLNQPVGQTQLRVG
ncbi:MAG: hypothetical protein FD135_4029 [Comamonadaceae bacterium]|nr:MAG: hypothetical protein FD135_4029 [Comamonadaceae bacterium]